MKGLSKELLEIVLPSFKGKKLEKLQNSIKLLEESLELGSWVKYASVKVPSGFQKLYEVPYDVHCEGEKLSMYHKNYADVDAIKRVMAYGVAPETVRDFVHHFDDNGNKVPKPEPREANIEEAHALLCQCTNTKGKALKMPSLEVVNAWIELNKERKAISKWLDASRKPPVITEIGLSPLVTATLKVRVRFQ